MINVLTNISSLVTLRGDGSRARTGHEMQCIDEIRNGALVHNGSTILWVGQASALPPAYVDGATVTDCTGKTVMPGFVDSHTHMVFAGSRSHEFARRLAGASYADIAAEGGGILTTMQAVRSASVDELAEVGRRLVDSAVRHGSTTIEIKSGYGLDVASELRLLEAAGRLKQEGRAHIHVTFLGAHAVPPEWKHDPDGYVDLVINEMLPAVAEQGIAEFCDVFTDKGFFTREQSTRILRAASDHGLKLKVHADEIALVGASDMAAELGCISADHLEHSTVDEVRLLRDAGVVCTLLPGTAYTLRLPFPDARMMIEQGAIVALATDCNPGSCFTENMQTILSLACINMRMSIEEAITAATINGAAALGISHITGSLETGKRPDVVIYDVPRYQDVVYHFGVNQVTSGRMTDD
ncbi:MAG: imidazolonepropionase [Candidatus Kapabacteria bacterium]|nr:imidazolonepropionase [Candidatus Kapabacteria bacterium]